jgi:hypothetical protein
MTMLHELSHAYHNGQAEDKKKLIQAAYKNAIDKTLYVNVPHRTDPTKTTEAYDVREMK